MNNCATDDSPLEDEISDVEGLEKEPVQITTDEIPDKFSGWGLCSVIGLFIFSVNTWGANSAYALYLQHYLSTEVFEGADKYDYAMIGGLAFAAGVTFGPLINYLVGKIGIKPVVIIGMIINFVGTILASFSTKLWEIYCTQGVMNGLGMALIYIPVINIVPQWFKGGPGGKRNLALGLSAAGSGVGGIIYNIGLEQLLKTKTFRWSLRAQAIISIGLNCVALCLMKSRNHSIKPVFKIYDKLVWHCFGYICMIFWIMFTIFGYVVLMYNLGDFTMSLGYSTTESSTVSTCVAVGIVFGRPLVGKMGDIIGPINVTILASWIVAIFTWAMWIPCRNLATAIIFALIVGSLMGTIWLTIATINASIGGLRKLGIALSLCWIAVGSFGFASPIIGIALKKDGPVSPTQYQPASIFVGLCYFMAGASLYVLRSWIIRRNEKMDKDFDEEEMLLTKVSFYEVMKGLVEPKLQKV